MESALRLELQQLDGLPFIAGIIWAALIGISLVAIVFFFFFRNSSQKVNKERLAKENQYSKPKGF